MRREVVEVITPGTGRGPAGAAGSRRGRARRARVRADGEVGLAALDASTGHFRATRAPVVRMPCPGRCSTSSSASRRASCCDRRRGSRTRSAWRCARACRCVALSPRAARAGFAARPFRNRSPRGARGADPRGRDDRARATSRRISRPRPSSRRGCAATRSRTRWCSMPRRADISSCSRAPRIGRGAER